jgi:hypothetical protein
MLNDIAKLQSLTMHGVKCKHIFSKLHVRNQFEKSKLSNIIKILKLYIVVSGF